MGLTRILGPTVGGGALVGAAALGYAVWEARQFTLRQVAVPLLPPGRPLLRVLHLSDLHLTPSQRVGELLDLPGVFVFGSNDYFSPTLRNPLRYLMPDTGKRFIDQPELPWGDLRKVFAGAGWADLTNQVASLSVGGTSFAFAGVDDPHLGYDDLASVGGPAPEEADVRLGVAHAPYLRVLDQFASDGYDGIIAGHTHGGQVCVPGFGALTTNCDLDRRRAKGLSRHPADSRPGDPGSAWLHVSAGLGTNPYTPIRLACRPEATLLTLTPRTA